MSKTPTTSATDEHSEYVPKFGSEADREAWKQSMLDEWKTLESLGELRPASQDKEDKGPFDE